MSSSYFRQGGKTPDIRKLLKEINDKVAKLESDQNEIETRDFSQIIRSNNDRVIYISTFATEINSVVLDPNAKQYQMTLEPDGNKLSLWLKFQKPVPFYAGGQPYYDESGFENHGVLDSGSPVSQDGPVSGLPSLQFDGIDDLIAVHNHSTINLQTAASSTGFSINFNINPSVLTDHNGKHRVIACKTDDSVDSKQWGWMIWLEPNGNLYFHVRIANVFYTATKIFAFPSVNKWYRVFCTFSRSTNTPKIYIDGTLSTDTNSTYTGGLVLPSATTDLYVGGNDIAGESYFSGFISDFRFWREKVITQSEIDNIQANGYSLSFTLFPARAGVGNFAVGDPTNPGDIPPLPPPPPPPVPSTLKSFTNTSFTSTSFSPA